MQETNIPITKEMIETFRGLDELPITCYELYKRYPNNWFRKLNLLWFRQWSFIYDTIQNYESIRINFNPFAKNDEPSSITISDFHEFNGKRYLIF